MPLDGVIVRNSYTGKVSRVHRHCMEEIGGVVIDWNPSPMQPNRKQLSPAYKERKLRELNRCDWCKEDIPEVS